MEPTHVPVEPGPERSGTSGSVARAAWLAELDRLEADVRRTELLLDDPTEAVVQWHSRPTWQAPSLGTLPEDLLPRAQELLARQADVRERLSLALSATSRQRDFTSRVSEATAAPAPPSYLDVTA